MSVLDRLGKDGDPEARRELAREVAQLFFAAEQQGMNRAQNDDFGAILVRMLGDFHLDERIELSERMSRTDNAPRDLVNTMARGEIDVARPVLENSRLLDEDTLVDISSHMTTEHRLAVSRRTDLTTRVTDTLIGFEEQAVMRSVASNATAPISENSFDTLAEYSEDDKDLLAHLAARPDIPEECATKIMPHLDAGQRAKLLEVMTNHKEQFSEMVGAAKKKVFSGKMAERQRRLEAKAMVRDVQEGRRTLDEICVEVALEKSPIGLAVIFSEMSMLPESKCAHAIIAVNGELLALMSRALELSFGAYREADRMRRERLNLPGADEDRLREKYLALDPEVARRTMRFVNVVSKVS